MLQNKQNTGTNILKVSLIFILALILIMALVVATHQILTDPFPGHADFLPRWEGSRSFWMDGINPYSPEASLNIQMMMYERPAHPDEDKALFAYPFYIVFFVLPLIGLPYAWAAAIWMVLLEISLILALWLIIEHFQWKANILLGTLLCLLSLVAYFPARGLILGQIGIVVYLFNVGTIWALGRKYDRLAGVLLALAALKPQMAFLFAIFFGLWAIRNQRWQFLASAIVTMALLLIPSFVLEPTWVQDWIAQIREYPSYTWNWSPIMVLTNWIWQRINPELGQAMLDSGLSSTLETLITIAFYLYLLWIWYAVIIKGKQERLLWTAVMTMTITNFVVPRTSTPHFVVFIIPLVFYIRWMTETYPRAKGNFFAVSLILALLILPWLQFLALLVGIGEHPTLYITTPLLVLMLLILSRKLWWNDERERLKNI